MTSTERSSVSERAFSMFLMVLIQVAAVRLPDMEEQRDCCPLRPITIIITVWHKSFAT